MYPLTWIIAIMFYSLPDILIILIWLIFVFGTPMLMIWYLPLPDKSNFPE